MNRIMSLILLLFFISTISIAQNVVVIPPVKINTRVMTAYKQKRQTVLTSKKSYNSAPIKTPPMPKLQGINVTQIVDLGLSVKWAGWNLGANSPEQYGGLYGWGDARGMNKSTDLNQYPSSYPPKSICGTQYDTARNLWGRNWRMPSAYELMELYNECTWQWMRFKGVYGAKVTGPNGNAIFIPAAGDREGFDKDAEEEELAIWSGASDPSDDKGAFVIAVGQEEDDDVMDREFYAEDRHMGLSIRPVYDSGLPTYELASKDLENFSTWGDGADFGDKKTLTRADMRRVAVYPILSMSNYENGEWQQNRPYDGVIMFYPDKQVHIFQMNNGRLTSTLKYYVSGERVEIDNQDNSKYLVYDCYDDKTGEKLSFNLFVKRKVVFVTFPNDSQRMIAFDIKTFNNQ